MDYGKWRYSVWQSYAGRWVIGCQRKYGRGYTVGKRKGYAEKEHAEQAMKDLGFA